MVPVRIRLNLHSIRCLRSSTIIVPERLLHSTRADDGPMSPDTDRPRPLQHGRRARAGPAVQALRPRAELSERWGPLPPELGGPAPQSRGAAGGVEVAEVRRARVDPASVERFVARLPGGPAPESPVSSTPAPLSAAPPATDRTRSSMPLPSPPTLLRRGSGGSDLSEFGPIRHLVSDPAVTDVFLNGAGEVWADRGGGAERHPEVVLDEEQSRALAVRLVALGGRHVDESKP